MGLGIVAAEPATAVQWDRHWRDCPCATYFESRAWAEIWGHYLRSMSPAPVLLRFSDGRRVLLPLTRVRRRRGLAVRYLLSPSGTYGGWLCPEPLEAAHARMIVDWLLSERRPLWWRPNPFDPCIGVVAERATERDITHVVPLHGWLEAMRARRGHMEAVRKARRAGVVVRRALRDEDWVAYLEVYEHTVRRWGERGVIRYGPRLFEALRRHEARGVELWLAEVDGRMVAGSVNLYSAGHAGGWHMVTHADHFRLKPTNLLVYDMVADAYTRGLEWFDMNPSGGIEGVERFKENCGGTPLDSPIVVAETACSRAIERACRLVIRS